MYVLPSFPFILGYQTGTIPIFSIYIFVVVVVVDGQRKGRGVRDVKCKSCIKGEVVL